MKNPTVSILCLTYNQSNFIKQCLDGFLMQKTNFKFEVLIHDDASTDGTTKIIQKYQKKHPGIINAIYQKQNQYSKGVKITPTIQLPRVKGKYIALCEGDDYWTDPKKLQLQVDFLDNNPDYSLCFHPVNVIYENGEKPSDIYPKDKNSKKFTVEELLKRNYIQTNSVMYRKQDYKDIATNVMPGDWYLHLYHAQFGKIGFIDRVMSVYRRHPGGIWWDSDKNLNKIWGRHGVTHTALFSELDKIYGSNLKYKKIIEQGLVKIIDNLLDYDISQNKDIIVNLQSKYPNLLDQYVHYKRRDFLSLQDNLAKKLQKINDLHAELESKKIELETQEQLLNRIQSSKFWKARNFCAKIVGREIF